MGYVYKCSYFMKILFLKASLISGAPGQWKSAFPVPNTELPVRGVNESLCLLESKNITILIIYLQSIEFFVGFIVKGIHVIELLKTCYVK